MGGRAEKAVARAPRHEEERIRAVLKTMAHDPFAGDVVRLKQDPSAFRRRVGDWRISFEVIPQQRLVLVAAIERRTTTYRRR